VSPFQRSPGCFDAPLILFEASGLQRAVHVRRESSELTAHFQPSPHQSLHAAHVRAVYLFSAARDGLPWSSRSGDDQRGIEISGGRAVYEFDTAAARDTFLDGRCCGMQRLDGRQEDLAVGSVESAASTDDAAIRSWSSPGDLRL
jgi:hypothetical protein